MNLGIAGRRALVCASSKGLGRACAMSLAREGVALTLVARGEAALQEAARYIHDQTGADVRIVVADIATEAGRNHVLQTCPDPDILVNNAGGPKPGDFRDWSRDDWIAALDANMLAPIAMIRATVDGMIARRFGRIVNITSAAVKHPVPTLGLSNGARSGLTGFVAGLSRQIVRHNVTINNVLPGPFDTDRLRTTGLLEAQASGIDVEEVIARRAKANPAQRLGDPEEFGDACAFFCSAQAGFITGQNLVLDGGAYPGTL